MIAVLCAVFFGCVAFAAMQLSSSVCSSIEPADDGPASSKPPYVVIVGGAAVVGATLAMFAATPLQLGVAAVVIFALAASWCSDALCGLLPDVFTLAPLGVLLLFALVQRDWEMIVSAVLVFLPFAVAAFVSRGYGMGWGDVKLVALTGAVLGAPLGYFTLALACLAAFLVHRLSKQKRGAIAFAPYIAALTAVALPLGLTR